MQENTHISCIRDHPPKLRPLLKLDEKVLICKNRSENFLRRAGSTMTTQMVARRWRLRGTPPNMSGSSVQQSKLPGYP